MKKTVCAALVLGAMLLSNHAMATTETVDEDSTRSVSDAWRDMRLTHKITDMLNNFAYLDTYRHRIGVSVFRGHVLLTGEVPTQQIKESVVQSLANQADIVNIYDALMVSEKVRGQSHSAHEAYLKTKLETNLLKNGQFAFLAYQLIVRNDTAFFLGQFTKEEQVALSQIAESTIGIVAVEFIDIAKKQAQLVTANSNVAIPSAAQNTLTSHVATTQPTPIYSNGQLVYPSGQPAVASQANLNQATANYANAQPMDTTGFFTIQNNTTTYTPPQQNPYPYSQIDTSASYTRPQSDYVRLYQNQAFAP